jgi:conjugative relaxase-like TrwC/TraI family protein
VLTIRTCKVFSHALGEYLRQADYYSEGMEVEGRSGGQLCASVGLVEGAVISDAAFERVASNHHAVTGGQLTERMKQSRRAGYDARFNAPKSVSIQAFVGGDDRLIAEYAPVPSTSAVQRFRTAFLNRHEIHLACVGGRHFCRTCFRGAGSL